MRTRAAKQRILREAAMYFAELGEIPTSYKRLCTIVPKDKPWCVQRQGWSKYFQSWGAFTTLIKRHHPELIKLAQEDKKQPEPEIKDPLEALRASSTEKTYE